MRSSSSPLLITICVISLAFAVGCGGGGGGGGSAAPEVFTVSGQIAVPDGVSDSWKSSSLRGVATRSDLGLTVQAFGKSGTAISEGQRPDADGGFSFTLPADADAIIKATNSKGFDFRFHLGFFSESKNGIVINASSTARAFLNWKHTGWFADLADDDDYLKAIVASITQVLGGNVTGGMTDIIQTIAERVRDDLDDYETSYQAIIGNNSRISQALLAANADPTNLSDAYAHISEYLHSTKSGITISKNNFTSVTSDRYTRYTIRDYSFTPLNVRFTSPTTASVTVSMFLSVSPKASAEGIAGSYGPVNWVIGWRKEGNGWLVWQDFPYLKTQFNL